VDIGHLSVVGVCGDCREQSRVSAAGGPARSA
jgi:hypothetical protein